MRNTAVSGLQRLVTFNVELIIISLRNSCVPIRITVESLPIELCKHEFMVGPFPWDVVEVALNGTVKDTEDSHEEDHKLFDVIFLLLGQLILVSKWVFEPVRKPLARQEDHSREQCDKYNDGLDEYPLEAALHVFSCIQVVIDEPFEVPVWLQDEYSIYTDEVDAKKVVVE